MPQSEEYLYSNVQDHMIESWRVFINNLEKSLNMLEKDIDEAAQMQDICTLEWCEATEHVIDEIGNSLFSISEPRWASQDDSNKIKVLKKRLHDLYAKYKATSAK